jgi:hypothetical protein
VAKVKSNFRSREDMRDFFLMMAASVLGVTALIGCLIWLVFL